MAFYSSTIQNKSSNDTYETPTSSLDIILERLNCDVHVIWEPFPGTGHSTRYMKSRGFIVVNGKEPDFFDQSLPNLNEIPNIERLQNPELVLVSNPPFSKKKEIYERLLDLKLDKIALLLPSHTLFTKYFRSYISRIGEPNFSYFVHRRCNFLDPNTGEPALGKDGKRGSCSFDIGWFCSGLDGIFPFGINFQIEDESRNGWQTLKNSTSTTLSNVVGDNDNDNYEPPEHSLDLIFERLDPDVHVIWEPFPGTGDTTKYWKGKGFLVVNGPTPPNLNEIHLIDLIKKPELILVSKPPFSKKKEILKIISSLNLSKVALLLPAATMHTKYFHGYISVMGEENFRFLVHSKRCNFIDPVTGKPRLKENGKEGTCSFDIGWFCSGLQDKFLYGINYGLNEDLLT